MNRTTKGGYGLINDIVWSMFQGYKDVKNERDPYKELEKVGFLYDVADLRVLSNQAKTKEQHESILDHMYKFDATRVDYYSNIEKKIIQLYWEG
ncbi:MAG: hypothetical protein K0Q87_91 [Neobacillus sp.]|jgi:hypothetical protein|nr:hypothetical protein [Neobacillus sp.]